MTWMEHAYNNVEEPDPAAEYVVGQFKDNMPLEAQVDLLGRYLLDEWGGPWRPMGAIEMAIRLLEGEGPPRVSDLR